MAPFKIDEAFYLKLGRGGEWEAEAIASGKLRFDWRDQKLGDLNSGRWDRVEAELRAIYGKKKAVATQSLHGIRHITESDHDDVWITFHQAKLWWTRVDSTPVEQDHISKFRRTAQPWSDRSIRKRLLVANELPGKIAKLQGYRWTTCRVDCPELLQRTLAGTESMIATAITADRAALARHLSEAIRELHWKDFETLVDLIFRHAGWVRVSVLGQHAKAYDLELREPITGFRYVVQVKSRAGLTDLRNTIASFSADDYRRVFFIVHSPAKDLARILKLPAHVQIVFPDALAQQAIDAGLVEWLKDKVS